MGREYRVLSKLHSAYPEAPRVLLFSGTNHILGSSFYLTQPIRGVSPQRSARGLNFFTRGGRGVLSESLLITLAGFTVWTARQSAWAISANHKVTLERQYAVGSIVTKAHKRMTW